MLIQKNVKNQINSFLINVEKKNSSQKTEIFENLQIETIFVGG